MVRSLLSRCSGGLTKKFDACSWFLLAVALAGGFVTSSFADSSMSTVLPYTCGTRITPGSPVNGGTRYGRIIRLHYNGNANGTLIATYESWPNNFNFYRSTDDGLTWTPIGAPTLSSIPNWVMKVEPDLFELPMAAGNLPAGTILLAGNCRTNDFIVNSHRMEVWSSTNQGATWQYRGVADTSTNLGLWEPHLSLTSSNQLVCYYSDERFASSGYNQLLGERVSPDGGLTWGAESYVCAVPDGAKRPGMAVTAKLPNGQYVLSYEGVGFGGWSQVYIKFSSDGINWGSGPTDLGTPVQTASGAYVGATPYILWSPAGGPNGTLVVSGQFLINSPNTDREFFINTNLGQGNWTLIPAAVQWQGGGNNLVGWSQGMIPTADGQGVIQMSSSQITISGNTSNNEMRVGREQLILPGQTYNVANQNSGLALEIPGNSATPGTKLQQGTVNGGPAQLWTFNDQGNNVWTVTNPGNQLAWDDTGWGTTPGTPLEQWTFNGPDGLAVQQFKLRPVGNGGWNFINVNAGLTVTVTNAATTPGAAIVLWTNTATAEQNWFPSQPVVIPVADYALNGNPLDGSDHGNDGTPNASATNYVTGRNGSAALQFNGVDSYVQIPRSLGAGAGFGIAFWMKTTSTGGTGANWYNGAGLVDGEVAGVANDFGVTLLGGRIAFGIGNPDTTLQSTTTINDGQWHFVAVVRNGLTGTMAIFLDGVLNTNLTGPVGARMSPPSLRLGSLQTGVAGQFYNGVLEDVRLFNGWLDTNAIAQLFTEPTAVAQLKFDESSGTTAADATGHGWNGTLVNGPTWVAGQTGNAVSLNGVNQCVSLPAGVVSSLNDFSIAAWVYVNAAATWNRVFDFGSGTPAYMALIPQSDNGTLRFDITIAGGNNTQKISTPMALPAGGWHHVAVTLNAGVGVLYLDGAPVGTNSAMTITPSMLGVTTQNWIGRSQYSSDPYLNGMVDDLRIYSGALSPNEIASLVTPLAAPAGFVGTMGDGQASLNWNASLNANGYNLKRSLTNGGPYALIAANLSTLAVTDDGLLNGTNYYYAVTATNAAGESGNSVQVNVRPVSATPPQLSCSLNNGQLQLAWPGDHTGWLLQIQTNSSGVGLGTNWVTLPGSGQNDQYPAPVASTVQSVFYRLLSPY